ncbi:hypothetical protein DQ04_04071000 [Trypanosoma grayi]|uniref:hypothetical protein n=1 Tax=Trypanosoma grayi TaxID=71804 RepID=UPI0004F4A212|nr:hypothetical protein DQ04_04071000 [Trypanosoma grayi]KEG10180.1 hypothetical protein DQ04_04071000 [Trypanosoma grayi]
MSGCSIAQCIALGVALVVHRGRRGAKARLLDAEILQPLSLPRRVEVVACCSAHDAGVDALLSMSLAEGAGWLLQLLSGGGYGPQVDAAVRFAAES